MELEIIESKINRVKRFDEALKFVVSILLLVATVFVGSSFIDMFKFTNEGIETVEYHNFPQLLAINPDTVAWIILDNTNINHPVVQGRDNFQYLDTNFYGEYYAGGSLFLDEGNAKDFSDSYSIIHGHHITGGAMFGDLEKYKKQDFFDENRTGTLLTKDSKYSLEVFAVGEYNAYDTYIYNVDNDKSYPLSKLDECLCKRDVNFEDGNKLLLLSTCSGDMNDERTIVFCKMSYEGENV